MSFLSLLFPDRCPYCYKIIPKNTIACDDCKAELPKLIVRRYTNNGFRCCSPFTYVGKYKTAILKLKFRKCSNFSDKLAVPMIRAINIAYPDIKFDYIAYVPMHKKKLRKRGYNQSQLLAKSISKLAEIPYINTLEKTRNNKEQHDCNFQERFINVKGVFKYKHDTYISGKNILLVDDIITTGNTLGECCKILKETHCNNIYCVTVCTAR